MVGRGLTFFFQRVYVYLMGGCRRRFVIIHLVLIKTKLPGAINRAALFLIDNQGIYLPINMLPGEAIAFSLLITARRMAERQCDSFLIQCRDPRKIESHVTPCRREQGFKQTFLGAECKRQRQRKGVARARQAHRFLCINDAVLDFSGFTVRKNGFAINTHKRVWITDGNRHRLRAAVGDAP